MRLSARDNAFARGLLTTGLLLGALATADAGAQPARLTAGPALALGSGHCGEIWRKSPTQSSRGKITATFDFSDGARAAFAAECAARGGIYSPDRCPRSDIIFTCPAEAANATFYTILYEGSSDQAALSAVCASGNRFSGRRARLPLRPRSGLTIWGSCQVP